MLFYSLLNSVLPGHLGTRLRFYKKLGYPLSLRNPQTFNEKVHWRKTFDRNPLFSICADKLKARDYVKGKIGEQFLIPLLYSGESITAAQLAALSGEFVVKANHNSGPVHLVDKHQPTDFEGIAKNIRQQLKRPYAVKSGEWWYQHIPRRVIVEKLLRSESGQRAMDYKFFVFKSGDHAEYVLQISYGDTDRQTITFYDEEQNVLPFKIHKDNDFRPFHRPENYPHMVELAKHLAADFDFCRVDLYNIDGQIYFGELTFAPSSGTAAYDPIEFDLWKGKKWRLPSKT